MNKDYSQFLENNGHYWIKIKGTKCHLIGKYDEDRKVFKCPDGEVLLMDAIVMSDLILRPTA